MPHKAKRRRAVIADRRLFGPVICRIGLCGRDGNCGVDLPGVRFNYGPEGGEIETWTRVWLCDKHAAEEAKR